MPRVCTVCSHKKRGDIEAALLAGELSNRRIASQYSLSEIALRRHRDNDHIPAHLSQAHAAEEVVKADTLLDRLQALNKETTAILREARAGKNKDNELALKAIARVEKQLELEGKLIGELQQEGTVNITLAPEWLELRAVILQAVSPYPQASEAVGKALSDVS